MSTACHSDSTGCNKCAKYRIAQWANCPKCRAELNENRAEVLNTLLIAAGFTSYHEYYSGTQQTFKNFHTHFIDKYPNRSIVLAASERKDVTFGYLHQSAGGPVVLFDSDEVARKYPIVQLIPNWYKPNQVGLCDRDDYQHFDFIHAISDPATNHDAGNLELAVLDNTHIHNNSEVQPPEHNSASFSVVRDVLTPHGRTLLTLYDAIQKVEPANRKKFKQLLFDDVE